MKVSKHTSGLITAFMIPAAELESVDREEVDQIIPGESCRDAGFDRMMAQF